LEFIDELESFIQPDIHIVMKASKTRIERYVCGCWLDGGTGWLMSRAAVLHTVSYNFLNICAKAYYNQDDVTSGVIMGHTFPDARYWDSVRLSGNPYYYRKLWSVDISRVTNLCRYEFVWPARTLIAMHTSGRSDLITFTKNLRGAPEDLALEWTPGTFQLCRRNAILLKTLTSLETLRQWTPIVPFRLGGQVIEWDFWHARPPMACRQCLGMMPTTEEVEQNRLAMWNRTGWQKYY
jgi:hypothetical protein